MDPCPVCGVHNALGPENGAAQVMVEAVENVSDLLLRILLGCFLAPTGENFVGMMMVMMLVIVMTAAAMTLFRVMMVMLMVMVSTAMTFLVVVMVMLMVMVATAMTFLMFMMVMTTAVTLLMFMMVMFVVMMAAAAVTLLLVQVLQFLFQSVLLLNGPEDLLAVQLVPGSGDNGGGLIERAKPLNAIL